MTEHYDGHALDEVSRDATCDGCSTEFTADFRLVFDDVYEHECPNCGVVAEVRYSVDDDGCYDSYYDR